MNDQVLNSSKTNKSNVQKAIFEQEPIIVPVVFEKSEELKSKSMDKRPFGCESSSNNKSQKKSDSNGLKIDRKNKNVKKTDYACTECKQVFDNPMKFYRHFRLKHKEIVQVNISMTSVVEYQFW